MTAAPAQAKQHELVGAILSRKYPLKRVIGSGGMGTVFESQNADGTPCAIKLLATEHMGDLEVIQQFQPQVFSTPVSPEVAATMVQMLVNGVSNGAASNARISGVEVGGKTGTAENGEGEAFTLWFTGFAPATDPQVAIAVVLENGGGFGQNAFGNMVAAPMAKIVIEAVLSR